jgi:RimJ/RimL family protein N-acetyltransferase
MQDRERTLVWKNEPETRTLTFGYRFPVTEVMEDAWLERAINDQSRTRIVYGIEDKETSELLGFVQLFEMDSISGTASLGIAIGPTSSRRMGIGTEAVNGILEVGRRYFNIRKVSVDVLDQPQGARAFYEKLGFVTEGVFREHIYYDSDYLDVIRLSIFLSGDRG